MSNSVWRSLRLGSSRFESRFASSYSCISCFRSFAAATAIRLASLPLPLSADPDPRLSIADRRLSIADRRADLIPRADFFQVPSMNHSQSSRTARGCADLLRQESTAQSSCSAPLSPYPIPHFRLMLIYKYNLSILLLRV